MNYLPNPSNTPQDVIIFVGPIVAPEGIKRKQETAIEPNNKGDRRAPDETLEIKNEVLRKFAGRSPEEASPLRQLLSVIIDQELGPISTFVGIGFIKGTVTPTLTIHLNRSKTADGTPLGNILRKEDGEFIASILGLCFGAAWTYTCWICPAEPIDHSKQISAGEEK